MAKLETNMTTTIQTNARISTRINAKLKIPLAVVIAIFACYTSAFADGFDKLVDEYQQQKRIPREQAEADILSVFNLISNELTQGTDIQVRNFGTFYVKKRDTRQARNPKTGEKIQVPARYYPRFRYSDKIKDSLKPKEIEKALAVAANTAGSSSSEDDQQ